MLCASYVSAPWRTPEKVAEFPHNTEMVFFKSQFWSAAGTVVGNLDFTVFQFLELRCSIMP